MDLETDFASVPTSSAMAQLKLHKEKKATMRRDGTSGSPATSNTKADGDENASEKDGSEAGTHDLHFPAESQVKRASDETPV